MANFSTHLTGAVITSSLSSVYLFNADFVDESINLIPLSVLGVIGGFLPDIDSDHSTSARYVFNLLTIALIVLTIIELFEVLSIVQVVFVSFLIGIFVRIIFFWIFKRLTVHRGIIHSVPCGILFSLITIYFLQMAPFISDKFAISAGIILFIGYITHLVLDELYAVNLAGLELKASFGTALKFIKIGPILPSLIVYSCIVLLWTVIPNLKELLLDLLSLN
tara:strand:+ start:130 stop:792 length:663 start_codon:yes stop_codon:yes gene_type:complete